MRKQAASLSESVSNVATQTPLSVLIIEDVEDDALLAEEALRAGGYAVTTQRVDTAATLDAALISQPWDLLLCDYTLPHFSGLEALAVVRRRGLDTPFILLSGTIGEESAVEAMRAGAQDYIMKGNPARLVPAVRRAQGEATERRQRRQAEEALRASERRYRSLVETSPDAIALLDLQGVIQMANQQAATLYHHADAQALLGRQAVELLAPADRARAAAALAGVAAGAAQGNHTYTARRQDGTTFTLELRSTLIPGQGDSVQDTIMIVARDITERVQAAERLRLQAHLLETVGQAIVATDVAGVVTYWNHAAEDLYGWPAAEALGQHILTILPMEQFRARDRQTLASLAEGDASSGEYLMRHRDGHAIPILATAVPVRDEAGAVVGRIGVSTDISTRVQAEQALRESERFAYATIDALEEHIAILDERGVILAVNAAWRTFGQNNGGSDAQAGVGTNYLAASDAAAQAGDAMAGQMAQGIRDVLELRVSSFGQEYPCHAPQEQWWFAVQVTRFAGEGPVRAVVAHQNITARVYADERLIAERDLLQTLMDAVPDAIYIKDSASRFLRVNAAHARLLGAASPQELVGKTDFDYYPPALAQQLAAQERRLLTSGAPLINDLEDQASSAHGKRWILSSKVPLGQGDQNTGLVGISRDITALKQAEEERERFFTLSLDLLCVAGLDGYFISVNPAFEQTLGFTPQELCAEPFLSFVHPDDQAATLDEVATLATGVPATSFENRYRCKDGTYRLLVWTTVPADGVLYATARDITERRAMEHRQQQHIAHTSALHVIDTAIATSLDLRVTLGVILDQVCTQLGVDAAQVLVLDEHTLILEEAATRGFQGHAAQHLRLRLGQGHAGRAALEQRLVMAPDFARDEVTRVPLVADERFVAYAAAPLLVKGQVQGVLEVFHRAPLAQEPEWLDFLRTLAEHTAISIDNAHLYQGLQRCNTELRVAYDATIDGWSRALDLRDKETEGHSQRVTTLTLRLARALGMAGEDLVQMRRGALLHDIGKMGIPDAILLKPGPLTEEEWVVMRRHPASAYDLLSPVPYLRPALDIPYCHHEKWDGTGYPRCLQGDRIPLAARVFAVADVADALLSDRPYRPAWSPDRVSAHIASLAGTHFDAAVVDAFLRLVKEEST